MPLPSEGLPPSEDLFPSELLTPSTSPISREMYDALGYWSHRDGESTAWALLEMVEAIGGRLQPIEDVIRDAPEGDPGWSVVVDVDRAPASWLPWLAQMGGVRFITVLSEEAQREYIKTAPSLRRGSLAAMLEAVRLSLTGTKTIYVTERHGSAYRLTITTLASETPDPARLLEDILSQKPAGIILTLTQSSGGDYITLRDTHQDYADVEGTFTDYDDVLVDPSQQ